MVGVDGDFKGDFSHTHLSFQEQLEQEQQQAMENQAAMAMVQNGTKGDMTANGADTGAL